MTIFWESVLTDLLTLWYTDKLTVAVSQFDGFTVNIFGYTFQKYDDHVVFYHLEVNIPDQDLHVTLFYKVST